MMTSEEIQELRLELGFETKDVIMKSFYTPIIKFLIVNEARYKAQLSKYRITDFKKIPSKEDMLSLVFKLYGDEEIMKGFLANYSERDQKIIYKAVWDGGIDRAELEKIFQKKVIADVQDRSYYSRISLIPELKPWEGYIEIVESSRYYGNFDLRLENMDLSLSFPSILRKLLALHLTKPKGYLFQPISEPGEKFKLYLTEKVIFNELGRIIAYHGQGNIKYSQKGNPNAASAKKMSKTLKVIEFSPENEFPIRSLLLVGMIGEDFKMKTITDSPDQIIRKLFAKDFNKKQAAPYLLSHLKGLNYFLSHEFRPNTTSNILHVFKQLPQNEWISFENLQNFVRGRFLDILPLKDWILRQKVQSEYETNDEQGVRKWSVSLHAGNIQQFVWRPYLAGHVHLLAAFGLMDIAVDPSIRNQDSAYDNLYALRLTKLGSYVLGLTKEFIPPEHDNRTSLSFDESSPIIRIEGDVILGDALLANYATKVSENRYQFSPGKFLKECRTTKDLQNKIVLFKQTVGQKLPAFWENYLQQLVTNSKMVEQKARVQVFTLPPDNKDLHRIVAQDEVLRKIVIKAEQFHLLVLDNHIPAFLNRMKELGYLLG